MKNTIKLLSVALLVTNVTQVFAADDVKPRKRVPFNAAAFLAPAPVNPLDQQPIGQVQVVPPVPVNAGKAPRRTAFNAATFLAPAAVNPGDGASAARVMVLKGYNQWVKDGLPAKEPKIFKAWVQVEMNYLAYHNSVPKFGSYGVISIDWRDWIDNVDKQLEAERSAGMHKYGAILSDFKPFAMKNGWTEQVLDQALKARIDKINATLAAGSPKIELHNDFPVWRVPGVVQPLELEPKE